MKMTTYAKRKTNAIKKDVMAYAWKLARKEAIKENCSPRDCIAWALYEAWKTLKFLCTARTGFHKDNKYGSFMSWKSDFSDIAVEFPNICVERWAVYDRDSGAVLYVGTLADCERFRWSPSWFNHFGHLEHTYYMQGFWIPLLWA